MTDPALAPCTVIAKAVNEAVLTPSETLIVILLETPTFAALGVPVSWPVAVLNAAHDGRFLMLNVSDTPVAPVAVGLKV